jgi:hypothetical protein
MKINTIVKLTSIAIAILLMVCVSENASAKQYAQTFHGRHVVVHTNPLPVVLHRMVPPQYGRHVTQREIQAGRLPSGRIW